ncbi:magnesium/cobalt transporter CorA [Capnocytophaga canimorsus]|uniref:magnesium/cobalt transporter CorA n=1 Tax=Capnocytophaga canimorsus TaxID=28188 RepID=UPI0037D904D6
MTKKMNLRAGKKRKSNKIKKVGMPPGTLMYMGDKQEKPITIDVLSFNDNLVKLQQISSISEAFSFVSEESVTWINVNGLTDIGQINEMGNFTQLHSLLLEDILDTEHRPKLEILDDNLLIIIKMLYEGKDGQLVVEHLALLLGQNYVISLQEVEGEDVFSVLRKRIQNENNTIRKRKSDYLLYGLLDAIVDNYFLVLDKISEQIQQIEHQILANPQEEMIFQIQNLKKEAIALRKTIHPTRELVSKLEKLEHPLISSETHLFLKDLYEHSIHISETLESYRDMLWGLTDTFMGAMSNKMNNVMRLLTLISTIFIPLTFIAGVYGMNFKYMPELEYQWAYPVVLVTMFLIGGMMFLYFKSKKWL